MKIVRILCAAALAVPLYASSLSFSLSPSIEYGVAGTEVIFSGTLLDTDNANTCDSSGTDCLDLNNLTIIQSSSYLTLDANTFFNDVPGFYSDDGIPLNDSYTPAGPIFGIQLAPNTPGGVYTGTVTIEGAHDDQTDTTDPLATQSFTILVAPEPAPFALALLGLATIALLNTKARQSM